MTDKIEVIAYQAAWPIEFEKIKAKIWPTVKSIAVAIEHVGSTSVPGLAAKPRLDIDVVVESDNDLPGAIKLLAELGYTHRGDLGIIGREAFYAPAGSYSQNFYLVTKNCMAYQNHILLRDRLRKDAEAMRSYAELKFALAKKFPNSIDAYCEGKTEFITGLLAESGMASSALESITQQNKAQ